LNAVDLACFIFFVKNLFDYQLVTALTKKFLMIFLVTYKYIIPLQSFF